MSSKWFGLVIDSESPAELAEFWRQVLDYKVMLSSPEEVALARDEQSFPGLIFVPVPEDKQVKNRLHIDLNPDDQNAEVERLLSLGATRANVGQGDVRWVVMADPEGNEFCVLTPHAEQA
jgi:predicted enzyme related to lactoylglutathione lyase